MALFTTPERHTANPPATWAVVKHAPRSWALTLAGDPDAVLGLFPTRQAAEQARREGFLVRLYRDEGRWFAGESVPGWRPYVPTA